MEIVIGKRGVEKHCSGTEGVIQKDQRPSGAKTKAKKSSKKGFYKYATRERKFKGTICPYMNKGGRLIVQNAERAVVLQAFLYLSLHRERLFPGLCVHQ